MINNKKIKQLREIAKWVRVTLDKAANLEISIWSHPVEAHQSIEYRFWVRDDFHVHSRCIDTLLDLVMDFKTAAEADINMEL